MLLHHVGAKSGTERIAPLASQAQGDAGNAWVIIASKAGAPTNPDWYHNLLANPATTIEVGTETVFARVTEGAERTRLWEATKAKMPTCRRVRDQDREKSRSSSSTAPLTAGCDGFCCGSGPEPSSGMVVRFVCRSVKSPIRP